MRVVVEHLDVPRLPTPLEATRGSAKLGELGCCLPTRHAGELEGRQGSRSIPAVVQPILEGHADVVYGSRFLVRKEARVLYYYHYLGNRLLTTLSNILTNLNMTDIETGYKAFRGEIIRNMIITSNGFGFEVEVTAKVAKLRCAVYEVPISYYGRTYEQGKKIGFVDGLTALWLVLRFNLFCSRRMSFQRLPDLRHTSSSETQSTKRGVHDDV